MERALSFFDISANSATTLMFSQPADRSHTDGSWSFVYNLVPLMSCLWGPCHHMLAFFQKEEVILRWGVGGMSVHIHRQQTWLAQRRVCFVSHLSQHAALFLKIQPLLQHSHFYLDCWPRCTSNFVLHKYFTIFVSEKPGSDPRMIGEEAGPHEKADGCVVALFTFIISAT